SARAEDAHVVEEEAEAPAGRRPEEPRVVRRHDVDEREERDDAEVRLEVRVKADLGRGAKTRPLDDLLLRRGRVLPRLRRGVLRRRVAVAACPATRVALGPPAVPIP